MTVAGLEVRYDISLTNLVGFLVLFATLVASWTSLQGKQADLESWRDNHVQTHTRLDERWSLMSSDQGKFGNEQVQLLYRVAQIERAHEAQDLRISRLTENYGNQFTEMRGQLGAITTQLALANDALKRLEASRTVNGVGK